MNNNETINLQTLIELSKDLTVLYVEDDLRLQEKNTVLFERLFKSVTACANGLEALKEYRLALDYKDGFDIIITDITMPEMNGLELSRNILNINEEQLIMIMSAYNDSDKLETLLDLGIQYYIKKPANINKTIEVLYKVSKAVLKNKDSKTSVDSYKLQNIEALKSSIKNFESALNDLIISEHKSIVESPDIFDLLGEELDFEPLLNSLNK